ncbi:MAG: hypothetical protein D6791_10710 [Chloroflexi bacterium]|nr:MAG: hypothetical protein D6791_10710 [Chloroflexota bacterium]
MQLLGTWGIIFRILELSEGRIVFYLTDREEKFSDHVRVQIQSLEGGGYLAGYPAFRGATLRAKLL